MRSVRLKEALNISVPTFGLPIGQFVPGFVLRDIADEAAALLIDAGHAVPCEPEAEVDGLAAQQLGVEDESGEEETGDVIDVGDPAQDESDDIADEAADEKPAGKRRGKK